MWHLIAADQEPSLGPEGISPSSPQCRPLLGKMQPLKAAGRGARAAKIEFKSCSHPGVSQLSRKAGDRPQHPPHPAPPCSAQHWQDGFSHLAHELWGAMPKCSKVPARVAVRKPPRLQLPPLPTQSTISRDTLQGVCQKGNWKE